MRIGMIGRPWQHLDGIDTHHVLHRVHRERPPLVVHLRHEHTSQTDGTAAEYAAFPALGVSAVRA